MVVLFSFFIHLKITAPPFCFHQSKFQDNSPVSSPHSSTPISFDVSFTKSFDTPSFHSPISNQLNQNSLYPCQTDHVFMEMKSDTILTWDKKLETPHQQLATPERPKIDKSAVVSPAEC